MEENIGKIIRYLAGLAVLLSLFIYVNFVASSAYIGMATQDAALFVYELGFLVLVLAVMGYTIGDEKLAKMLFGISILLTAISLFFYEPAGDTSSYYYMYVLSFLLFGLILLFKEFKGEDLQEQMKDIFDLLMAAFYFLATLFNALASGLEFEDLISYRFWVMGDITPQSLVLGASFSAILSLVFLIYVLLKIMGLTEVTEFIDRIINIILVFFWILGFMYATYIYSTMASNIVNFGAVTNLLDVFMLFVYVVNVNSILYSILVIALVVYVIDVGLMEKAE